MSTLVENRNLTPAVHPTMLQHNEELWRKILGYDLSKVTATFAVRNPEHAAESKVLEVECKRFLYLAALVPHLEIAPTKPIDEYWHQFVLFTEDYEAFCEDVAGYFVHHNPLAGPNHEFIFKRTQEMVTMLFGDFEHRDIWFQPMPATSCKDFCVNRRQETPHKA